MSFIGVKFHHNRREAASDQLSGVVKVNRPDGLADIVLHVMPPVFELVLFDAVGQLAKYICSPLIERSRSRTCKVQFNIALQVGYKLIITVLLKSAAAKIIVLRVDRRTEPPGRPTAQ